MAYCVAADVQTYFPHITFGSGTPVTTSHITDTHIPAADALINGALRRRYAVPITDASDLALLKSISMRLTAQAVADILFRQIGAGEQANVPEDAALGKWGRSARLDLDAISEGKLGLATSPTSSVPDAGVFDDYDAVDTREVKPLNRMNDVW